jgi:hypothetical protein
MAPTNIELMERIIYEGFLVIALGAVTCKKYRREFFIEVMNWNSTTSYSCKYLESKEIEVEVFSSSV